MVSITRSAAPGKRSKVSLRFRDAVFETDYLHQLAGDVLGNYRIVVPFAAFLWLGIGVFDHRVMSGDSLDAMRWMRFGLVGPLLVLAVAIGYAPIRVFARAWQPVLALAYAGMLVTLIVTAPMIESGSRIQTATAISITMIGGYTLVQLPFVYATAISAAATVAITFEWARMYGIEAATLDSVNTGALWVFLANAIGMFACYQLESFRRDKFCQRRIIENERQRADQLLGNVLPASVAERLKGGDSAYFEAYDEVTVLFGDLVGFTSMAERLSPRDVVRTLNELFTEFDQIAERYGLEKIKTIGDAYMVVGGVPKPRDDHALAVARMAVEMVEVIHRRRAAGRDDIDIRIGLHTGPVVAGVIGTMKFSYDVWGDTVNVASRMQTHGVTGAIQVSHSAYRKLRRHFEFEERGDIAVKGKGDMRAYVLRPAKPERTAGRPLESGRAAADA